MTHKCLIVLGWLVLVFSWPAYASNEPVFADVPGWVADVEIPEPDPERNAQPVQMLLVDTQSRYELENEVHFVQMAALIQNPQGLTAVGTVTVPWQPDHRELTIHYVRIIRDGAVIDVLENGQEFVVLRRENNLELATLDGVLTAVLQPEGLAVGDIITFAYSTRSLPSEIAYQPENLFSIASEIPIRSYAIRQLWSPDIEMRWLVDDMFGEPRVEETARERELSIRIEDARMPERPEYAPARYLLPPSIHLSAYESWADISALFAPYYAEAAELRADSPIQAEIDRIAAAHATPEARALAALRLVQERIRYVALQMGSGGHIPASADQTWSRRYGDCKGKTATLLAILRGLGIEAEAALVSTAWGDALSDLLPQLYIFDHVIVRAVINGQTYWLDGTRLGDTNLTDLRSSLFGSALPLRSPGAALEQLPVFAPAEPLVDVEMTYDASGGVSGMIPVSGVIDFRGDMAVLLSNNVGQLSDTQLHEFAQQNDLGVSTDYEIAEASYSHDPDSGVFTLTFSGTAELNWNRAPGSGNMRFRFSDTLITWDYDFERETDIDPDAPFALTFPSYSRLRERVILPDLGDGYSLDGEEITESLAGNEFARTLTMENGVAQSETVIRRIRKEIPAESARRDFPAMETIGENDAYLVASADTAFQQWGDGSHDDQQTDDANARQSSDAEEFELLGGQHFRAGDYDAALAAYDRALAIDPTSAEVRASKIYTLLQLSDMPAARQEWQMLVNTPGSYDDPLALRAIGAMNTFYGRLDHAVNAFRRSLALQPRNNRLARLNLITALANAGRFDEAEDEIATYDISYPSTAANGRIRMSLAAARGDADMIASFFDTELQIDHNEPRELVMLAELQRSSGLTALSQDTFRQALILTQNRIASAQGDPFFLQRQIPELLFGVGDAGQAISVLDHQIEEQVGDAMLLGSRCWIRARANLDLSAALTDCQMAREEDPESFSTNLYLAWVYLSMGRFEDAIAIFNQAQPYSDRSEEFYYGRAIANFRLGNSQDAADDLAMARYLNGRFNNDINSIADFDKWFPALTLSEEDIDFDLMVVEPM